VSYNELESALPTCFANMSKLKRLRLTDAGLVGGIPGGLCNQREMNSLLVNTVGCDAIACGPGTYLYPFGRVTSSNETCIPCRVQTNFIGMSKCVASSTAQSITPNGVPSSGPTTAPSSFPSLVTSRPTAHSSFHTIWRELQG